MQLTLVQSRITQHQMRTIRLRMTYDLDTYYEPLLSIWGMNDDNYSLKSIAESMTMKPKNINSDE